MANTTSRQEGARKIAAAPSSTSSRRTQMRGAVRTVEEAIKSGDRDAAFGLRCAHARRTVHQSAHFIACEPEGCIAVAALDGFFDVRTGARIWCGATC